MSVPVRLNKKTENTMWERIDAWALAHANILMPICIVTLLILFALLCYAIIGVSAVESGTVYNHFNEVI